MPRLLLPKFPEISDAEKGEPVSNPDHITIRVLASQAPLIALTNPQGFSIGDIRCLTEITIADNMQPIVLNIPTTGDEIVLPTDLPLNVPASGYEGTPIALRTPIVLKMPMKIPLSQAELHIK